VPENRSQVESQRGMGLVAANGRGKPSVDVAPPILEVRARASARARARHALRQKPMGAVCAPDMHLAHVRRSRRSPPHTNSTAGSSIVGKSGHTGCPL